MKRPETNEEKLEEVRRHFALRARVGRGFRVGGPLLWDKWHMLICDRIVVLVFCGLWPIAGIIGVIAYMMHSGVKSIDATVPLLLILGVPLLSVCVLPLLQHYLRRLAIARRLLRSAGIEQFDSSGLDNVPEVYSKAFKAALGRAYRVPADLIYMDDTAKTLRPLGPHPRAISLVADVCEELGIWPDHELTAKELVGAGRNFPETVQEALQRFHAILSGSVSPAGRERESERGQGTDEADKPGLAL